MNFIKEAKAYKEEQQFEQQHSEEEEEEEEEGMRGEEEEEEEEEREATTSSNSSEQIPFPCPSSSSPPPPPPLIYRNFFPYHSQEFLPPSVTPRPGSLHFPEKLDLPDLSLANNNDNSNNNTAGAATTGTSNIMMPIEKEHMFDKVVTPSDVGKLNRLVIPKQHAEKYFPLDSSNEKGMLLNFEDRNGKPWRFRYSFWNSSQSYVMTKGWSRFVKEKKLDAGDIVSFQRGAGEEGRHRLFIDWRRRPNVNPNIVHYPYFPGHLEVHNQLNFRWGNQLLYSLPHLYNFPPSTRPQPPSPLPPPPHQFQYANLGSGYNVQPFHSYQFYGGGNVGSYYGRPSGGNQGDDVAPMVIDSVPVAHGRTVGKRLRLFGVNMDCPMVPSGSDSSVGGGEEIESHLVGRPTTHGLDSANSLINLGGSSLQWRLPSGSWDGGSSGNGSGSSSSGSGVIPIENMQSLELSKKGKTSLSFDLDL